MKRSLLALAVIALYLLHQDFWFWRAATPLVFGFLPVGLFYHLCYTLVISGLMWLLVKHAWPSQLEERRGDGEKEGQRDDLSVSPSLRLSVSDLQEGRNT